MRKIVRPKVAVIFGSMSDVERFEVENLETGEITHCGLEIFDPMRVGFIASVYSAHRNDDELREFCDELVKRGVAVFICVAGRSAHLAGVVSAHFHGAVPVLGVAMSDKNGNQIVTQAAVLSQICMPPGTPLAFMGEDLVGLINAAQFATSIVAYGNSRDQYDDLEEHLIKNGKKPVPQLDW